MIYLTLNDLKTHAFEQFINESSNDFIQARDTSELQNIELIKSKLNGRYDTNSIFSETGTSRHALIVRVLTLLVIYDLINRNKARKVPKDIDAGYQWAKDWLDAVRDNQEHPNLPSKTDGNGNPVKFSRWGNNLNQNFYL